jgi:predicted PurR-regulated permease PerM
LTVTVPRRFRFAPILTGTVLTVLLLILFGKTAGIFLLLFVAVLISLYLGAVAEVFQHRLRLPPRFALASAIVLTLAAVITLFRLLVPPVVEQTQQLVRVLPQYVESWEMAIGRFVARYPAMSDMWRPGEHKLMNAIYEAVTGPLGDLVPKVVGIVHAGINVFSVAVMSIYLAAYPGVYREWVIALFPPIHRDLVRDVLADLKTTLRAWIVGQLLAMVVLAVLTLVSTTIPALFVLGGDGFAGFGGGGHAVLVILLGTVIHLIESNLVIPLITAKKVELPPVLTIMSVLVVGSLLGPVGLLVAVPTLAVTMVVLRRILINRIYEGHGFRRASRDRALVLRVPAPEGGVLVTDAPDLDVILATARAA